MYRIINAVPYKIDQSLGKSVPPPPGEYTVYNYSCYQNGFLLSAVDKKDTLLTGVFCNGALSYVQPVIGPKDRILRFPHEVDLTPEEKKQWAKEIWDKFSRLTPVDPSKFPRIPKGISEFVTFF